MESKIFEKVVNHLKKLGYPESIIIPEYNIRNSRVDAIVKNENGVFLAIEFKENINLELITMDELGYHPTVRNLQKAANELKAPYFILTEGKTFLWLKTGKNGRPELIDPVIYISTQLNDVDGAKELTKAILYNVESFLKSNLNSKDFILDFGILLYLKLNEELGDKEIVSKFVNESDLHFDILNTALEKLRSISFLKNKRVILEYIDDFFSNQNEYFVAPRWLANFMVDLIGRDFKGKLLDIFSRNGTIGAVALEKGISKVASYYINPNERFWIAFQQKLLGQFQTDIHFQPQLLFGDFNELKYSNGNVITFVAPLHYNNYEQENLFNNINGKVDYLINALNSVNENGIVLSVVPDSFLLASAYESSREAIRNYVEAVISLPDNTFKPFSNTKCSVIILRNDSNETRSVFMAMVDSSSEEPKMISERKKSLQIILDNYNLFKYGKFNDGNLEKGFITNQLEKSNFHILKYFSKNNFYGNSNHILFPLKLITTRKAVSRNKILNNGLVEFPLIHSSAIKPFGISEDRIYYLSLDKANEDPFVIIKKDDILISLIGENRGSAVRVTEQYDGALISRSIIALSINDEIVSPGYLTIALNSKYVKEQLFIATTGVTIPRLNRSSFDDILIPVPPLKDQLDLVAEFEYQLNEINTLKNKLAVAESVLIEKLSYIEKGGLGV